MCPRWGGGAHRLSGARGASGRCDPILWSREGDCPPNLTVLAVKQGLLWEPERTRCPLLRRRTLDLGREALPGLRAGDRTINTEGIPHHRTNQPPWPPRGGAPGQQGRGTGWTAATPWKRQPGHTVDGALSWPTGRREALGAAPALAGGHPDLPPGTWWPGLQPAQGLAERPEPPPTPPTCPGGLCPGR